MVLIKLQLNAYYRKTFPEWNSERIRTAILKDLEEIAELRKQELKLPKPDFLPHRLAELPLTPATSIEFAFWPHFSHIEDQHWIKRDLALDWQTVQTLKTWIKGLAEDIKAEWREPQTLTDFRLELEIERTLTSMPAFKNLYPYRYEL